MGGMEFRESGVGLGVLYVMAFGTIRTCGNDLCGVRGVGAHLAAL